MTDDRFNIADRLRLSAELVPDQDAVVFPQARDRAGRAAWTHMTFQQLDAEVDALARGLIGLGVSPGHRIVLMVRPSIEFIALTFGIMRAGACCTLIDPGMGKRSVLRCLDTVDPDGFAAIPPVHIVRGLMLWRFRNARFNVVVGPPAGRRGCISYLQLVRAGRQSGVAMPVTQRTDSAAIIFTSGSTGTPKGVLYEHGMFNAQVELIRHRYQIQPGETDLPGFPLFSLFNLAMQVTSVIPDMDPSKPAAVKPERIVEAIESRRVTQAYGSPALWNRVGRYCEERGICLPGLRRIMSAGAPVPEHVLRRMTKILSPSADFWTPYGATECLPVSSISAREALEETVPLTALGKGTCVGRVFEGIQVRIIEASSDVVRHIHQTVSLPSGSIGEIIVSGPVVTREYFHRPDATEAAKIQDGSHIWHRMGDMGYLDDVGRLWFCGRKSQIVFTSSGPLYTDCCEAVFNTHPEIYRTALVGIVTQGRQIPVIVAEPEAEHFPSSQRDRQRLVDELLELGARNPITAGIRRILFYRSFPVDTRHNVKINREWLAKWVARQRHR